MIMKSIKNVAKAMLLCCVGIFVGCSNDSDPDYPDPGYYQAVYFTDSPDVSSMQPEVITTDADAQTVELIVKKSEIGDVLKMSKYLVAKWDDQANSWYYVKDSSTGLTQTGEFYTVSATEEDGHPTINVNLNANKSQQDRRLLLQVNFESDYGVPYGIVEIIQKASLAD